MKFDIITADPPWSYDNNQSDDAARGGAPYKRMTLGDICALPVQEIAAPNCTLFIWGVNPKPREVLQVIEAWGFRHVTTAFTWIKLNKTADYLQFDKEEPYAGELSEFLDWERKKIDIIGGGFYSGMGYHTAGNTENCLLAEMAENCILAKIGSPQREARDVKQLIFAPVSNHSAKPTAEVRRRIRRLMGEKRCIELFSTLPYRLDSDGWVNVGHSVDGQDIRDAMQQIISGEYLIDSKLSKW